MPAKDVYHAAVRNALSKDGWTITHDPYTLTYGQRDVFVDLGAEEVILKWMPSTNTGGSSAT